MGNICRHPKNWVTDMVVGQYIKSMPCRDMRRPMGDCSVHAKLFEPRSDVVEDVVCWAFSAAIAIAIVWEIVWVLK